MRAFAVFPTTRTVRIVDHLEPRIAGPLEVKLRILDVGICGTDKEICAFEYGTPPVGSDYLVLGHECLGEVIEVGSAVSGLQLGDLAVPTVRRPCPHDNCTACRAGRQDFCFTGDFTERGIKQRHGFMTEFVVEQEQFLNLVPRHLREVGVLVEPLTVTEKGISQLWSVQQRLPWRESGHRRAIVLGAGPVGLLAAMKLVLEGFHTIVYSRTDAPALITKIVAGIGAEFIPAESVNVDQLAAQVGSIDVIFEAAGASSLAFDVLPKLGANGVFLFTGIPGHRNKVPVEADAIMKNLVLKNQLVFGTVNASLENYQTAVSDIATFFERWPDALRSVISNRFPIEEASGLLLGKSGGVKNVIAI